MLKHTYLSSILSDSYKQSHYQMYPKGLTKLYSNFTARESRMPGVNDIVFFGLQYFILEYLIYNFNKSFFQKPKEEVLADHLQTVLPFASVTAPPTEQWAKLHDLGYLPLKIKAVPEGTFVPIGVPMLTVTNTHPDFAWLVNFIETILSTTLWQPITSATIIREFRKLSTYWAKRTGGDLAFVDYQNHDFSMRGMSSLESAMLSGAGHLTGSKGSDTIPASVFLKNYYGSDEIIAVSVPATEHSVMSCGGKENEIDTFERLLDTFPAGYLSVVSDTWDLWEVLTVYLPKLKDKVLARDGKLVIRPDSGNPVDIICGKANEVIDGKYYYSTGDPEGHQIFGNFKRVELTEPEGKGVIELLWDVFGGTTNKKGYKVLDPHIGAIYGDSITLDRANEICSRLEQKGFCSTNIVFGIGSYTYNYNTRDTFGMAMKATYCEVDGKPKAIFKSPVTDSGEKKSAKGLLAVEYDSSTPHKLQLVQEVSWLQESQGELLTVFENGALIRKYTLDDIRERIKSQL